MNLKDRCPVPIAEDSTKIFSTPNSKEFMKPNNMFTYEIINITIDSNIDKGSPPRTTDNKIEKRGKLAAMLH